VIGGGTVIITDRAILRGARGAADERASAMASLHRSHRTVGRRSSSSSRPACCSPPRMSRRFRVADLLDQASLVALLLVNGAGLVARASRGPSRRVAAARLRVGRQSDPWIVLLFVGTLLTASA
jgi:hypothetical protein